MPWAITPADKTDKLFCGREEVLLHHCINERHKLQCTSWTELQLPESQPVAFIASKQQKPRPNTANILQIWFGMLCEPSNWLSCAVSRSSSHACLRSLHQEMFSLMSEEHSQDRFRLCAPVLEHRSNVACWDLTCPTLRSSTADEEWLHRLCCCLQLQQQQLQSSLVNAGIQKSPELYSSVCARYGIPAPSLASKTWPDFSRAARLPKASTRRRAELF